MRRRPDYEWLDHTADLRIRVRGADEQALYESAALALTELMVEPPSEPVVPLSVSVAAASVEDRLVELLRELIFVFDVDALVVVAARAVLTGTELRLDAEAVRFDAMRHVGLREIKAVTYHALHVAEGPDGWSADVVFDV